MSELLPCPFCGSKNIDAKGWASTDRSGPACDDCGGSADTVELWNSRPAQGMPESDGYRAAWLELMEHCNKLKEENFNLRSAAQIAQPAAVPVRLEAWIRESFAGHGRALRRETDVPLEGEPWMSMDEAKELTRQAVALFGRATSIPAQYALPPLVDRAELVALLEDLASVNLSPDACSRQAARMADDLIARGLTALPSTCGQAAEKTDGGASW